MQKITAFVARSFASTDDYKIQPILNFLDSFRSVGFVWQTAKPAEVESVSKKVRDMIDASDVFVGILTRRYPVYKLDTRLKAAYQILIGHLPVGTWTSPSWVMQESGYALKGGRKLVLFRESGVEVPGLQGDLEYITYDPSKPAEAFQRANEMINSLIAGATGTKVEVVVRAEDKGPLVSYPSPEIEAPTEKPETLGRKFAKRLAAVRKRDWETAQSLHEKGLEEIKKEKPELEVFWQATYLRSRFQSGDIGALDTLKSFAEKNQSNSMPAALLASCLRDLREYREAASWYLHAASLCKDDESVGFEVQAARCLEYGDKLDESMGTLLRLWKEKKPQTAKAKTQVLSALYGVLRKSGGIFQAFSIGEMALQESPGDSGLRFSIAYDFENSGYGSLSLHHYKVICENCPENDAAVNNLGVAYDRCDLPALCSAAYRRAYVLGHTLAASNLGRLYLKIGMTDDAINLLQEAQGKEGCNPQVSQTLADVYETLKTEDQKERTLLETVRRDREFLTGFGAGFLSIETERIEGKWRFPFVEITLRRSDKMLTGTAEREVEVSPSGFGLFRKPLEFTTNIERFTFSGRMVGRSCEFEIRKETIEKGKPVTAFGGGVRETTKGYLVFAETGETADVVETKDTKLEKYYQISKSNQLETPGVGNHSAAG